MSKPTEKSNVVVVMAGGRGVRLKPLTDHCPKSLLKIGDKPILELIVEHLVQSGFRSLYLCVNYRAEMIEEYFRNGNKWGAEIQYIRESYPMGTAGALKLIPNSNLNEPVIVLNGDIITKINFHKLLEFHNSNRSDVTVCIRKFNFQFPYGVVSVADGKIKSLEEKPTHSYLINSGIYAFHPEIVKNLPDLGMKDMPDLIHELQLKNRVFAYQFEDYWRDIGSLEDLKNVQTDLSKSAIEQQSIR